jgi:hypothetical protein
MSRAYRLRRNPPAWGINMTIQTKTVVVDGQEMVMSSVDGRNWFLKLESLYEYERLRRQVEVISTEEALQID